MRAVVAMVVASVLVACGDGSSGGDDGDTAASKSDPVETWSCFDGQFVVTRHEDKSWSSECSAQMGREVLRSESDSDTCTIKSGTGAATAYAVYTLDWFNGALQGADLTRDSREDFSESTSRCDHSTVEDRGTWK